MSALPGLDDRKFPDFYSEVAINKKTGSRMMPALERKFAAVLRDNDVKGPQYYVRTGLQQ
jgi:hypothetical protein